MRIPLAAIAVLVLAGCSATGTPGTSSASPQPGSSSKQTSTHAPTAPATSAGTEAARPAPDDVDPCELLTADDLATLGGPAGLTARPGVTGGVPQCQWPYPDGRYVQVVATSASLWARSMPELLDMLRQSGMPMDDEHRRSLEDAAALVDGGGPVEADDACELFSLMLELRGRPPGEDHVVSIVPSSDDPRAVTAQMCADGRFSSVMIASTGGLDEPLPVQSVVDVVQSVHLRALA